MKKLLFFLSFVLLVICLSITAFAAYLGDVNNDGSVTAGDARIILRCSAQLDTIEDGMISRADVDGNEKITASDARKVLRMSAKLDALQELTTNEPSTEAPTTQEPTRPTISANKSGLTITPGSSEAVKITVENIEEYDMSVYFYGGGNLVENPTYVSYELTENDNGAVVTVFVKKVALNLTGKYELFVGISEVGSTEYVDSIKIPIKIEYSALDTQNGKSIMYMSDRSFSYDEDTDSYILKFGLQSKDLEYKSTYGLMLITITNDVGEEIYSEIHDVTPENFNYWSNIYGTKYLGSINIPASDIQKGTSEDGTVIIDFVTPWSAWESIKISANDLPKKSIVDDCSVELPETPVELSRFNYKGTDSKFRVDDITYKFEENRDGTVDLKLYFSGEKTYDDDGNNISASCYIAYKLYDAEGYVVKSGTAFSDTLKVGEKQKNITTTIYNLDPGKYTLELLNSG